MKYEVNDKIKKEAADCTKKFSCLTGERTDLCEVEECIENDVYFIKCLDKGYCVYRHSFGHGYYCSCPIRKEIYKKYKK